MKNFVTLFLLFAIVIIPNLSADAKPAEKAISFIRDDEAEKFLQNISNSVFKAAGLDPDSIKIVIINDPAINAFVADGQKLFIHTGLIIQAQEVSGLIGVIAHETGHIKGAHTIQKGQNAKDASIGSLAGYVLGAGAILAGAPTEAGMAIGTAGQNIATRSFLAYSREYESAADIVALNVLKKIGISPRGLAAILRQLLQQQKISGDIVDQYLLTHPVTDERINYVMDFVKQNPDSDRPTPAELEERFKMVKAKIMAFLGNPDRTRLYYNGQNSLDAIYARAIAFHKEAKFKDSLILIDQLIAAKPTDPYFSELKAQFLFEQGDVSGSISQYRKVLSMVGSSVLIRLKLAEALLSTSDKNNWQDAIGQLKAAQIGEPQNITLLERLGVAYGKLNKLTTSYLYLAEGSIVAKNKANARRYLTLAENSPGKTPQDNVKLNDLKKELDRLLDKE